MKNNEHFLGEEIWLTWVGNCVSNIQENHLKVVQK